MPTSAIPDIIDALFTQATSALPNVSVYDGYGTTDEAAGHYLMVGVEDPDSLDSASSTDSTQETATMGTPRTRDQRGDVTCVALSWTGDSGNEAMKQVRDAVYTTVAVVEDLCRTSPDLGITGYQSLLVGYGSTERLLQNQDTGGAEAAVIFSIRFRARI